jgi:putative hydrolase of the HAD superfamily
LADLIDACVVSGTVGIRKPDPRIFALAIAEAGGGEPVWMIGDGEADILGAHAAGLPSIWLTRGREWHRTDVTPTDRARDLPTALDRLLRWTPEFPCRYRLGD